MFQTSLMLAIPMIIPTPGSIILPGELMRSSLDLSLEINMAIVAQEMCGRHIFYGYTHVADAI